MNEEKKITGYPSIDKPWLKYYPQGAENRPMPKTTLYRYIYEANKDHKTDYAFNYFGKRITYGQLFYEIDRCAKALLRLGVKSGDIVTIMGLAAPETYYCIYALNKIGAVPTLINVLSNEKDIINYLNDAKSTVFIALDLFNDKVIKSVPKTKVKTVINLNLAESMPAHIKFVYHLKAKVIKHHSYINWKSFIALSKGKPPVKVFRFQENRLSYISHTGGTSGIPKSVMLSDESLNGIIQEYTYIFEHKRQDRFLNTIVPFACYGFLINTHVPLALGMEVVLVPKIDIQKIPRLVLKHKINFISTVPPYLEYMYKDKKLLHSDLSFIKTIGAGGDGMTEEIENNLNKVLKQRGAGIRVMNGYGLTEICATSCGNFKKEFKGSVGYPLCRNVFSAFEPETDNELKYNEIGEICINTPYLMLGYLNNPEATNEAVRVHKDGKKWFHTGDLGYITEEGAVFITGRMKRIILTEKDGMVSKIFPDRVEKLLETHKAVEVSCVVKQPSEQAEVKLTAHIVLKEQYRNNTGKIEKELQKLCNSDLPEYSRPSKYVFRDSMPLTAAGKVDFMTLEKLAEETI